MKARPIGIPPGAEPSCTHCRGQGYVVRPQGVRAQAEHCSCYQGCPECDGTGWVASGKGRRRRRCGCERLATRMRAFNRAGLPARHAGSTRASFRPSKDSMPAFTTIASWLRGYNPGEREDGLVLWGGVGRGKTHLMGAMVRELIFEKGVSARFVEFTHLLADLKSGFDQGVGPGVLLDPLVSVDVLAIDELGKGRNTEFELTVLDELVSRRYNAGRALLATTNHPPGAGVGRPVGNAALPEGGTPRLADRVGDRVYSRLREMCAFQEVAGPDYRERIWAERSV